MSRETRYLVIPSLIIREHAVAVPAKTRGDAWRLARSLEPVMFRNATACAFPEHFALELGLANPEAVAPNG
jgi:hypothetical protein